MTRRSSSKDPRERNSSTSNADDDLGLAAGSRVVARIRTSVRVPSIDWRRRSRPPRPGRGHRSPDGKADRSDSIPFWSSSTPAAWASSTRRTTRRLGRHVALKFLPPHLGKEPAAKERLLVEARAAAALDHPNICTILEIGETDDGQLFLAMPLYSGETIAALLKRGRLRFEEALPIALQIARGLGVCPRARHRASRHKAVERHVAERRHREDRRLRHRHD